MINRKFRIGGMHCQGCETVIEQSVAQLSGVQDIKADFVGGTATVSFAPTRIDPRKIVEAIDRLGYQCSPSPTGGSSRLLAFGRLLVALLALTGIAAS